MFKDFFGRPVARTSRHLVVPSIGPGWVKRQKGLPFRFIRTVSGGSPLVVEQPKVVRESTNGKGTAPPAARVPFVRASYRRVEPAFDVSQVMQAAATVELGPFDIPAQGYIRHLMLIVTGSGGALGGGTLAADSPYAIFDTVELSDPGGSNVVFPVSGYELYLLNRYGGYAFDSDPANHPDFLNTVNPAFLLRLPVEINAWDGYGALANQSSSNQFKVRIILGAVTTLVTGGAPTAPTIRIRGYLEAWQKPGPTDHVGNPTFDEPPGHGTVQFWRRFRDDVAVGAETIALRHVGNFIRTQVLVGRTAAGVRDNGVLLDPIRMFLDGRQLIDEPRIYRRGQMREVYGFAPETGVLVYTYSDDQEGHAGFENRNLWVPTVQGSRHEFQGTIATAGTLTVLTNDVAPMGGR